MTNCDDCAYFNYDEYYDCYVCDMNLDEDEAEKFMRSAYDSCPYYRSGDDYELVRHQN